MNRKQKTGATTPIINSLNALLIYLSNFLIGQFAG